MSIEQDPNVAAAAKRLIALVSRNGGPEPIKQVPSKRRTEIDFGATTVDVIADENAAVTGVRIEINHGRLGDFREKGSGGYRGSADPVASAANKTRKVCKDSSAIMSAKTRLVARRRELVAKIREALPDLEMSKNLERHIDEDSRHLELTPRDRYGTIIGPMSLTLVCEDECVDRYSNRKASKDSIDIDIGIHWHGVGFEKAIEKIRGLLPLVLALPQFEDDHDEPEEDADEGEPIDAEWDDDDEDDEDDAMAQGDCDDGDDDGTDE